MTAPDMNADVRARFEEWFSGKYPEVNKQASSGDEMALFARVLALQGYRAAHADLAGEVRELVEADRAYDKAEAAWDEALRNNATDYGEVGSSTRTVDRAWQRLGKAARRRSAALAKFHPTHQEKP